MCDDRLTGDDQGNRHGILCPWHAEHTTGDEGTSVWAAEDGRYPAFKCLHAHCQGRSLRDLLEWYGKEAVDACCAEQFGDHGHDLDADIEAEVERWRSKYTIPPPPSDTEKKEQKKTKPIRFERWSETKAIRHMPDAPNGITAAEVMALAGLKKWKCGNLLGKAVNGHYAVRVGLGDTRSPSTYYRTPAGKALVEQYGGRFLLGR
jgi:hypothetical protein